MRALKILVVVMGVLIVAGVAVLLAVIAQRVGGGGGVAAGAVVLDEPAGTAIVGSSLAGERLLLQLRGGGTDRVVVIDLRTGRPAGRVGLAR